MPERATVSDEVDGLLSLGAPPACDEALSAEAIDMLPARRRAKAEVAARELLATLVAEDDDEAEKADVL